MKNFKIYIDDKEIIANEGERVLDIARKNGIDIPALCYHCDLEPGQSCRLCMVEVEGEKKPKSSCALLAKDGMRIHTETSELKKLLKINLELLFAQHGEKCETCGRSTSCKLRELAEKHSIDEKKYANRKKKCQKYQFGPSIILDQSKCIDCQNCSEICAKQTKEGFLKVKEDKYAFEICPSVEKDQDCIYCGQCILHCPTGALSEVEDYKEIKKLLKNPKKKVIFQFAPAVRTSLGEEFEMVPGENVTDKIFAGLKKIGAYKVFDTSFGADVTIIEEAKELIEKIEKNDDTVMLSSCCPAWVKYVEFYEPSLTKYLTSVRSPQIIVGGLIKRYWAKKEGLNSKQIVVVSIMPCTAKKFEVSRSELGSGFQLPVDYSLTVREFAKLFKEYGVDLKKIIPDDSSKELLANPSGAGEIFGSSGGVLEAALRTVYHDLTGKDIENLEFETLHQFNRTKFAEVNVKGKILRVVAVSGMENAKKIIEEIKIDPKKYAYVEVMACPGGCIGGGGQPIPINDEIRRIRANGLYLSDEKRNIRTSHGNPGIKIIYDEFLNNEKNIKKICHTYFKAKKKGKIKKIS